MCSGDGAGMMTGIPWELLKEFVAGDDTKKSGVGMFFLPQVSVCVCGSTSSHPSHVHPLASACDQG